MLGLALLVPRPVDAKDQSQNREFRQRCANAYESAQEQRLAENYLLARNQLLLCRDPRCPEFISQACTSWLVDVNATIATVIFEVRRDGQSLTEVSVLRDGVRLLERIDGDPLELDPGQHRFVLLIPGQPPIERQLTLLPAEKNRLVRVLVQKSPEPSPPIEARSQDASSLPWVFGGVGVLGLSAFAGLAAYGANREAELRDSCAPDCRTAELDSVRRAYLFADISLGIGLLGLGTATTLFLTSDTSNQATAPKLRVGIMPLPDGVASVCEGSF